jgi:hypothetical protein
MFEITLVVVPPGGGEAEYNLPMRVPALPREGDYVSVMRKRDLQAFGPDFGTEDFIVRRVWWTFDYPDDGALYHYAGEGPVGELACAIGVECEMAKAYYSSERHAKAAGPNAKTFEASAY